MHLMISMLGVVATEPLKELLDLRFLSEAETERAFQIRLCGLSACEPRIDCCCLSEARLHCDGGDLALLDQPSGDERSQGQEVVNIVRTLADAEHTRIAGKSCDPSEAGRACIAGQREGIPTRPF